MNMFDYNADFYPTPVEVIERMMMDESVEGKVILEPSAGKGDIVDWLNKAGAKEVVACETDPWCLRLLSGKCRMVGDDFLKLTAEEISHVQMIVMNPPFSKGVEHIQHAWDIAPAGCTIVALCNHGNFGSYRTTQTKVLDEVITDNGYRESLGRCFTNAERMTQVEVELIKLFKHGEGASEFDGIAMDCMDADAMNANTAEGLVQYNFVRDLVNRYREAVRLFDNAIATAHAINEVACFPTDGLPSGWERYTSPLPIVFEAHRTNRDNQRTGPVTHAEYRKELQKYYWKIIFRKMKMEKYATTKLREDINRYVENNASRPFTMANIFKVLNVVIQTNVQRMQKAVEEAFDLICSLSAENSTAGETWKTNANYMVNRKFIVDYMCNYDGRYPHPYVDLHYSSNRDKLEDICKALCYLMGKNYDEVGSLWTKVNEERPDWGTWFNWGFFRCRGYKKGTMHFEFLDEAVWAKFNQTVAQARGWHLGKQTKNRKTKAA